MTNIEALQAALFPISYESNVGRKAMIDHNINGSAMYTGGEMAETIDRAALGILEALLSAPNITEGGYAISYDRAAIQERIEIIEKRLSKEDAKPKIVNRTNRW